MPDEATNHQKEREQLSLPSQLHVAVSANLSASAVERTPVPILEEAFHAEPEPFRHAEAEAPVGRV